MGKRLDSLEDELRKLKKAHNKLKEAMLAIAEEADKVQDLVDKIEGYKLVANRHKKRLNSLEEETSFLKNNLRKETSDIEKTVKDYVFVHTHNSQYKLAKEIIKDIAKSSFKDLTKRHVRIKTKTFTAETFKQSYLNTLGNKGYKLAALLEPPLVKETLYVFQKEVVTLPKDKTKKRQPA